MHVRRKVKKKKGQLSPQPPHALCTGGGGRLQDVETRHRQWQRHMQPGGRSSGCGPRRSADGKRGAADRRHSMSSRPTFCARRGRHHFQTLDADGMAAQQEEIDELRGACSLVAKQASRLGAHPPRLRRTTSAASSRVRGRRVCQKGQPSREESLAAGPGLMR